MSGPLSHRLPLFTSIASPRSAPPSRLYFHLLRPYTQSRSVLPQIPHFQNQKLAVSHLPHVQSRGFRSRSSCDQEVAHGHSQEENANGNGDAKEEPGEQPKTRLTRRFRNRACEVLSYTNLVMICLSFGGREKGEGEGEGEGGGEVAGTNDVD
jgi:hypothetical protein